MTDCRPNKSSKEGFHLGKTYLGCTPVGVEYVLRKNTVLKESRWKLMMRSKATLDDSVPHNVAELPRAQCFAELLGRALTDQLHVQRSLPPIRSKFRYARLAHRQDLMDSVKLQGGG